MLLLVCKLPQVNSSSRKESSKWLSLMDPANTSRMRRRRKWFESSCWPKGEIVCECGSLDDDRVGSKPMPYRCRDCKRYFSLKTNTAMDGQQSSSGCGLCIYLELTNLKGVSSMKLHRDLRIAQPSAWFMLHRSREGSRCPQRDHWPAEVDERSSGAGEEQAYQKERKEGEQSGRLL